MKQTIVRDEPRTATLSTALRFPDPDAAYARLAAARRGLSVAEAGALDARLVLILANQIGDMTVLDEAITLAKQTLR